MSSGSDCASAEAAAATLWCHETVAESAAAPVVQDGKGVPPPPNLPADIHALLAMCNLAEYAEALVDAGYDDVQFLLEMSDDKIETILTEAGMAKVGHRKRFVSCVRKLRAAAA